MVGYVSFHGEKRPKLELAWEDRSGLVLLRAAVSAPTGLAERRLERRVDKAVGCLRQNGVRRVLAEPEDPWWPVFTAHGLGPVEAGPLAQAMAGPLVLAALARQGCPPEQATVALTGRRVSRSMFQAAEALCSRVRRLAVAASEGGEALAAHLRAEFGLPVLEGEETRGAQVTAAFSPDGTPREGAVLRLWGVSPDLGGLRLSRGAASGENIRVLTLLWENGRVHEGEIAVI